MRRRHAARRDAAAACGRADARGRALRRHRARSRSSGSAGGASAASSAAARWWPAVGSPSHDGRPTIYNAVVRAEAVRCLTLPVRTPTRPVRRPDCAAGQRPAQPALVEALGGKRGLIDSGLPAVVFVFVNSVVTALADRDTGLRAALVAAVLTGARRRRPARRAQGDAAAGGLGLPRARARRLLRRPVGRGPRLLPARHLDQRRLRRWSSSARRWSAGRSSARSTPRSRAWAAPGAQDAAAAARLRARLGRLGAGLRLARGGAGHALRPGPARAAGRGPAAHGLAAHHRRRRADDRRSSSAPAPASRAPPGARAADRRRRVRAGSGRCAGRGR